MREHSRETPLAAADIPIGADPLSASYDKAFARAAENQSEVYGELAGFSEEAHVRRMELLDALDVGDLRSSVVVDYGVGPWGFAAVYPRLQHCGEAIGIDISEVALRMSRERALTEDPPFGPRYRFLQCRGDVLPLDDASVDLFFAGEAIEHVEMPDVFLDEVFRVLRPGGQLVLTTPNISPVGYRITGDDYAIGPEHIALMSFDELESSLEGRFELLEAKGYNASLHFQVDDDASLDGAFRRTWAREFEDAPRLATGVVLRARTLADGRPRTSGRVVRDYADSPTVSKAGDWATSQLHEEMWGARASCAQDELRVSLAPGTREVALLFWAHDWSGRVEIELGQQRREVDLYSRQGGFRRVRLTLPSGGSIDQRLVARVRPTGTHRSAAHASQVIFFAAFSC